MPKTAVDAEYLSDVWTRINSTLVERGINKKDIAENVVSVGKPYPYTAV